MVGQSLFNKVFTYENLIGNVEPVSDPDGFLVSSTIRYDGGHIDGFQFTRFDSMGEVVGTRSFSTGPLTNVMQWGAVARSRSDGSFSFLFGNNVSPTKWSLRIFNTSSDGIVHWNRKLEYQDPASWIMYPGVIQPAFEETPDGGYLISGIKRKWLYGGDTIAPVLIKLNGTGDVVWNKCYFLEHKRAGHIVAHVDTYGSTLFGFHADSLQGFISNNCFLVSVDPEGNTVWSKKLGGFTGHLTGIVAVDGGYAASAVDATGIYLLKIDAMGAPVWGKRYEMDFPVWAFGAIITATADQGFVLSTIAPDSYGRHDVLFFKVDALGHFEWGRRYGTPGFDDFVDFTQNADGTFTLLASVVDESFYYYFGKLDSTGINDCVLPTNQQVIGTDFPFYMDGAELIELEDVIISQPLYMADSTSNDILMTDTCMIELGIPSGERLEEPLIFPNPTSGPLTIRVPDHMEPARLIILDAFGKKVETVALSSKETQVNLSIRSSGVYLYRIVTSGGKTVSGRLLKL